MVVVMCFCFPLPENPEGERAVISPWFESQAQLGYAVRHPSDAQEQETKLRFWRDLVKGPNLNPIEILWQDPFPSVNEISCSPCLINVRNTE